MIKRKKAFFVKRVRGGKQGSARRITVRRRSASGASASPSGSLTSLSINRTAPKDGSSPLRPTTNLVRFSVGIHFADRIVQTAKDTTWHSPFPIIGELCLPR